MSVQDICGLYFIANNLSKNILPPLDATALASAQYTLHKQADMQNIINNENDRIQQKKALVDNAIQGQQRMLILNDSYRQRNVQYRELILVAIITLALFIGIIFLKNNVSFIPEWVLNILTVIIIGGGIVYGLQTYYGKIASKNNVYFDHIDLAPPASFTETSADKAKKQLDAQKAGNLLGTVDICTGASCCATGTIWSDVSMSCIPVSVTVKQGFTTMTDYGMSTATAYDSMIL